jgi:hypothetical protein
VVSCGQLCLLLLALQHDPLGANTRQQLLDLALHYGNCFRFQAETCYDAWELLQRLLVAGATPPLGASGSQMWRLMLVACMMIASKQPAAELPGAIPTYDVVSLNTGYSADSIISTEQNIHLVLNNDASAVSALRVCQVLLERLGGQHQEARQATLLTEELQAMVYRVCCSSTMFRVQPSLVAMAVVYCLRSKRGLVPLWPTALVQLTGIYDPTVGDVGLVHEQLKPLLGVSRQPAAEARASTGVGAGGVAPGSANSGDSGAGAAGGQPAAGGAAQGSGAPPVSPGALPPVLSVPGLSEMSPAADGAGSVTSPAAAGGSAGLAGSTAAAAGPGFTSPALPAAGVPAAAGLTGPARQATPAE